jgi:hypothetical protein
MEHILIADLPDTVQQFIRSVKGTETLLVLDDDGAVIANITAIPNRSGWAPDRGIQYGHGNTQTNVF